MKFADYLEQQAVSEWRTQYVDYAHMIRLIQLIAHGAATRNVRQPVAVMTVAAASMSSAPQQPSQTVRIDSAADSTHQQASALRRRVSAFGTHQLALATAHAPSRQQTETTTNVSSTAALASAAWQRLDQLIPAPQRLPEELEFFEALETELAKVDALYAKEVEFFVQQRSLLYSQLVHTITTRDEMHDAQFQKQFDKLKESTRILYHGLNLLLNFSVVNHLALVKLLGTLNDNDASQ